MDFVPSFAWAVDSHFSAASYCAAEVIEKGSDYKKGIDLDLERCDVFEAEDCDCLCHLYNDGHAAEG